MMLSLIVLLIILSHKPYFIIMMKTIVRKIGLVAHDAMKKDMIEWVLWNSELLMGHKFYCTGTTGTLILEALKEIKDRETLQRFCRYMEALVAYFKFYGGKD